MQAVKILGHRGVKGLPENTLAGFKKALEEGAEGVEFDIHLSQDGVLVVIHDETLERTTTGTGRVDLHPVAELKRYAIKDSSGKIYENEHIPTLEEVLQQLEHFLLLRPLILNIEIKARKVAQPLVRLLAQYITRRSYTYDHVIVSSFNHKEIADVRVFNPRLHVGLLCKEGKEGDITQAIHQIDPYAVHPSVQQLKHLAFHRAHHQKKIFCWVSHEPPFPGNMDLIKEAITRGVDGVITDYPTEVRVALEEEHKKM